MRKMIKGNLKLDVVEHIILRNMWEYYVLSDEGQNDWVSDTPDIVYALVMCPCRRSSRTSSAALADSTRSCPLVVMSGLMK